MTTLNSSTTVGELVRERPARARIFEELGIDYCCGGKRPLSEACAKKGHDVDEVLKSINKSDSERAVEDTADYASLTLDALAEHIVAVHHANLVSELPRLQAMAAKVAKVHGNTDPRLIRLATVVAELAEELLSHMAKEERVLFPVIRELAHSTALPHMPFGTLKNPIQAMESEHDISGKALEEIRRLTDAHCPPDWACNTYRALLDGLHELELDLHQHIHKENNILFPGALAKEASLR
ncbi:MAG: iron-sulfur cluster repair di-iron protein [Candidatus Hydrogenedentota bacterium]